MQLLSSPNTHYNSPKISSTPAQAFKNLPKFPLPPDNVPLTQIEFLNYPNIPLLLLILRSQKLGNVKLNSYSGLSEDQKQSIFCQEGNVGQFCVAVAPAGYLHSENFELFQNFGKGEGRYFRVNCLFRFGASSTKMG